MKSIKQNIVLACVLMSAIGYSQITLNACHELFENESYVFNQVAVDVTGRNVYQTTTIDGAQACSGLGVCEFQIIWNDNNSRWELQADDGNGGFSVIYVIYSNTTASKPNPPSLNLGAWAENSAVTESKCGAINSLSGDVQETILSVGDISLEDDIKFYPNPASNVLNISSSQHNIDRVDFFDVLGRNVHSEASVHKPIDITILYTGIYLVKISASEKHLVKKLVIK